MLSPLAEMWLRVCASRVPPLPSPLLNSVSCAVLLSVHGTPAAGFRALASISLSYAGNGGGGRAAAIVGTQGRDRKRSHLSQIRADWSGERHTERREREPVEVVRRE